MNGDLERELDALVIRALAATGRSASEIIDYAANKFTREVVALTLRGTARPGGRGLADSPAQARREHDEYLRRRIREERKKKYGNFVHSRFRHNDRSSYLSKKEIPRYFARAKKLQGRIAAGWNASAKAMKVRVPAYVSRHGDVEGYFRKTVQLSSVVAEAVFRASNGTHGNVERFAKMALKNTNYALRNTAPGLLAKNIASTARKLAS